MEFKGMKILVVDDILDNIATIKALIQKNFPGIMVLSAQNGEFALELAISTQPDLILLDILMPEKDGYEVCKELKNNEETKDISVVFVTALKGDSANKVKALNVGGEGFLTKPIDESELIAQISLMLKLRLSYLDKLNEKERLEYLVDQKTRSLRKELEHNLKMEETIRLNERRYQALFKNLEAGVVVHDGQTKIISCNEKAEEILGLTYNQMIGKDAMDPAWNFYNEKENQISHDLYPVNIMLRTKKPLKDYVMGIVKGEGHPISFVNVNGVPMFDDNGNVSEFVISFVDITEVKQSEQKLYNAAYKDYLTGLRNRRSFEMYLAEVDEKENIPLSIIMADINGLKLMNDAFGHFYGDELLIKTSEVLTGFLTNEEEVFRIGGDEFAIVMPGVERKDAEQRMNQLKSETAHIEIQGIKLSISTGISTKVDMTQNVYEIFREAEDLMYRQKLLKEPSMRGNAIQTILQTLHEKDKMSEEHSRKVSYYAERLSKAHGLSNDDVEVVRTAALLHDVGKIIIPLNIINKNGKLTDKEYQTIQTHSEIGYRILNSSPDFKDLSEIVLNHHERWDGSGYPRGIKGENIPFKSRIITIADAFDAMTNIRTYRKSVSFDEALEELKRFAGKQFDPELVNTFETHFNQIIQEEAID